MAKVSKSPDEVQPTDVGLKSLVPGTTPEPLEELSAEERAEWRKFTQRMPIDWFPPETHPMLAQLCRHICQSRWVGQCLQEVRAGLLDPTDEDALTNLMKLQSLHDREGRAMTALMVRLRLTSQQRIPDADVADRARERVKDEHVEEPPWAHSARMIAGGDRPQ
jgi:hypothetical protein